MSLILKEKELVTPFTDDAQPQVRGKCPLELASCDLTQLPMARIYRGWALGWPLDFYQETVPNMSRLLKQY